MCRGRALHGRSACSLPFLPRNKRATKPRKEPRIVYRMFNSVPFCSVSPLLLAGAQAADDKKVAVSSILRSEGEAWQEGTTAGRIRDARAEKSRRSSLEDTKARVVQSFRGYKGRLFLLLTVYGIESGMIFSSSTHQCNPRRRCLSMGMAVASNLAACS